MSILNKKALSILKGRTILISGASMGVGEALTQHLLHYPVHLILVARTSEKLLALKERSLSLAATVTTYSCDFYSEESIAELCRQLDGTTIDYFVSNAGKSLMRSAKESSDRFHDYKRTTAVNYLAPVQLISTLLNNFQNSRTHIVNISTYNVLMKTPPGWAAYVSSKKAMHSWFEGNRAEFETMNISFSTLYFPLIESRMKDANPAYRNTKAMKMDHAINVIVKALLHRTYNYKPWWHAFAQLGLFFGGPFWNVYWRWRLKKRQN